MADTNVDEFFAHYGVPGMKWGRRKGVTSASKDFEESRTIKKKKPSQMSNEELKKLTTRMNLEQQYNKLNPSSLTKGKKTVAAAIAFGTTGVTLYNMVNSPAGKAAILAGRNAIYKARFAAGITKAITAG